jgi:16S rRNA (cytosine967-C5)-methyltransferase
VARRTAYETLKRVDEDGAYSHLALDVQIERRDLSIEDRGLATRITYGVLTWRRALDALLDDAVDGGVRRLDPPVLRLLRIGLYQLVWLDRIPDHAAVDTVVSLTEGVGWEKATGLVNAVMRRLADKDEHIWWREADRQDNPVKYLGARYSLPSWLANRLLQMDDD